MEDIIKSMFPEVTDPEQSNEESPRSLDYEEQCTSLYSWIHHTLFTAER